MLGALMDHTRLSSCHGPPHSYLQSELLQLHSQRSVLLCQLAALSFQLLNFQPGEEGKINRLWVSLYSPTTNNQVQHETGKGIRLFLHSVPQNCTTEAAKIYG